MSEYKPQVEEKVVRKGTKSPCGVVKNVRREGGGFVYDVNWHDSRVPNGSFRAKDLDPWEPQVVTTEPEEAEAGWSRLLVNGQPVGALTSDHVLRYPLIEIPAGLTRTYQASLPSMRDDQEFVPERVRVIGLNAPIPDEQKPFAPSQSLVAAACRVTMTIGGDPVFEDWPASDFVGEGAVFNMPLVVRSKSCVVEFKITNPSDEGIDAVAPRVDGYIRPSTAPKYLEDERQTTPVLEDGQSYVSKGTQEFWDGREETAR